MSKLARDLTPAERKVCYSMSYLSSGSLIDWLNTAQYTRNKTRAVLIYEQDKIVGWGLRKSNGVIGIWVRPAYRRRGIGTKIINRFKQCGMVHTLPHDKRSELFFDKTKTLKYKKMRFQ